MSENSLALCHVGKSFSGFSLQDISFELPKGYIMGLVGSNGAGKTTTIQLIMNMLQKDSGSIEILGRADPASETQVKQEIGIVYDSNFFVDTWTVAETEKVLSMFYDEWNHETFVSLRERFELPEDARVGKLSRGMQMKLMLVCACSHNAKLLILDEPTSGLDPATRSELLDILQEYIQDGERSVLFSTHITTDLERIADYITYLENGLMTTVVLWQAYDLGYLAVDVAYAAATGELTEGATSYVSGLSGQTQVEGVSTYEDSHHVDGVTVYLGAPATFTLDTLDCWKS